MTIRTDTTRPHVSSFEPRTASLQCSVRRECIDITLIDDQGLTSPFKTVPSSEVFDAIENMIVEAENFTDCVKNWVATTSEARRRKDLSFLESAGERLGSLLFPGPEAARFLDKLHKSEAELVLVLTLDDGRLTFPWHLIRLPGSGCWLGEIACFRLPRVGDGGMLDVASERDVAGVVAGYADDNKLLSGRPSKTLPHATQAELAALRQTAACAIHILDDLPAGRLGQQALAELQAWLSRPFHLFHFNCHASDPQDPQGFTDIGLRIDAIASGRHVRQGLAMTGAVVLDVCSGAQGKRHWWDNCFAACLQMRGVPAICASTGTVTDDFGTRFSEELYKQVPLHDYRMFQAVRAAQKALLLEVGHPMALYYTFEGSVRYEIGRY